MVWEGKDELSIEEIELEVQQDMRCRCHTRIRYIWMKLWKEAMLGNRFGSQPHQGQCKT